VKRRVFLTGAAALLVGVRAHGQAPGRVRRIGYLIPRSQANELDTAFFDAMRNLGYIEGRTLHVEYRWSANSEQRAEESAGELAARNVEVIVTATTMAVRAATRTTRSIPIVMAASADPVNAGLIASLARPGGNVTGLTLVSTDTAAKRLQLLGELIPGATRVAILLEGSGEPGPGEEVNAMLVRELSSAARQLGMTLAVHGIRSATGIGAVFEALARERTQAVLVQASRLTIGSRQEIAGAAARHRLPAMYETEGFVSVGGLASYGPNLSEMYRRAAIYVDRILKGARPSELPVEQPSKFEFAINLKAARAIDLVIPPAILLRADRVIE
jgi:putative tryptophan/tyrosine transport system substrate-binding protein